MKLTHDGGAERLRCASLLKPPLFWAASGIEPLRSQRDRWERLARPAVTVSANDPTDEAWAACGGAALLDALAARGGVRFELEPGGTRSFGRVLVTAEEVARTYAALAAGGDEVAHRLLGWMREVPDRQTFGVRDVVAAGLGISPELVAVKAGWFWDEDEARIRTHIATVTETEHGVLGTVVLTALPVDQGEQPAYAEAYLEGSEVLAWHQRAAGTRLRESTAEALSSLL